MNMKRLFITFFISNLFFSASYGQTLIEQIEQSYSALDSVTYINDIISSYAKALEKEGKEELLLYYELFCNNNHDKTEWPEKYAEDYHGIQSVQKDFLEAFICDVKSSRPEYVLNLKVKEDKTLQIDTTKLAFNLFYFGKNYKNGLYVYCDNGEYSWQDGGYISFSKMFGENARKVFKRIMGKHPKHLLYCYDLEGMNTILYVIDKDIYIYRIIQMKEYKLDDYMNNVYPAVLHSRL